MDKICRACLISGNVLRPIDDNFIRGYKILTNISIFTSDGLPKFTCTNCLESIVNFILFRNRCMESENTLKQIVSEKVDSKKGIIKKELVQESGLKQELEVKKEEQREIPSSFDDSEDSLIQAHEDKGSGKLEIEVLHFKKEKPKNTIQQKEIIRKNTKRKESSVPDIRLKPDDNEHFCGICPKTFNDRVQLNEHLETHKNNKECEVCREKFHEWPSLFAHRITHIKRCKDKMCHYCESLFKSVYKLDLHYRSSHYEGENKMLSCRYCTRPFPTVKKLLQHISVNHMKLQTFQCDQCKKYLSSKHGLIAHLRKHSDDRPFKCDLCDYSCKYTGGVKAHKMRKHSATKAVACKNCGRDFASTEQLDKHDCKSRATMCPICGVIKSKQLTVHMATHHMGILFKCELCSAEFKSKSALKVHTEKHTGNRRYTCEFCSMKFYASAVLKKHRRVHTGEKPFVCEVCQRGFTGKHNLKVHMKVHGEDLIVKRVKSNSPSEEDTGSGLFYIVS